LRLRYLDGLRGLAIAGVVLFHAFRTEWPDSLITRYGLMGVELFFMISGFVILMTLEQCSSFGQFFARRWMRLYPAMLIACAVTLIVFGISGAWPEGSSVFPGLTLIDDRWYSWFFDSNIKSLDGAYWTLYLEMRFYVIFGLAYFFLGTRSAIMVLVAMSLAYLVLLSTGHGLGIWRWTDLHLEAWFAAGALFYLWNKDRRERLFIAAVAVGLLAAWIYYPSLGPRLFGAGLVGLFAAAVRYPVAQSVLSLKPLTWLGFISYPLYLIHSRIIEYAGWPGIILSLGVAYLIAAYGEKWVRSGLIVHVHIRQRA
jgi:peptidoglycan/LPS O-acetylase OafA/YrhL